MLTEDGNLSFQDSFILKPFITLAKWDKNLQLNIQDTVNIPIEAIGELLTDVVTAASNHIILDTDYEKDVFYSIITYFNPSTYDTNSARVLLLKYTKDLEILCSQTYLARDHKIFINGSVKNSNGNYYVAALTNTKDYEYEDINSEVILVHSDCTIPGMETLEEYLESMSTTICIDLSGVQIIQNPVSDQLALTHGNLGFPQNLHLNIYDHAGRLHHSSKAYPSQNVIKQSVQNYQSGLYVYQLLSDNKVIGVGKFIKL